MGSACKLQSQELEIQTKPIEQMEQPIYLEQIEQFDYWGLKVDLDNLFDQFTEYKEKAKFEKQYLEVTIYEQQKQILVLQNQINNLEEQIREIDDQN